MNRISALVAMAVLVMGSVAKAAEGNLPRTINPSSTVAVGNLPRTINTSGEAVVFVVPDEVIVNVGVETFDPQLDRTKDANDQASQRLLAAIKEMKVEEKNIQTANLEIDVRYKDSSRPSFGIDGYYARRAYAITLKDVKQFEKLVDTCLKNGANRLMGFDYRSKELRKHRDQARAMAIKAAKEKAVALSGELGCTVGQPRTINEGGFSYIGASSQGGWNRMNAMAQNVAQYGESSGEGGQTMPMGQIGIRANVSVTFDLLVPLGVR